MIVFEHDRLGIGSERPRVAFRGIGEATVGATHREFAWFDGRWASGADGVAEHPR
jgi:hypothetical protein